MERNLYLLAGLLTVGCAGTGGPGSADASDGLSYALREAWADSVEQAHLAEFLMLYQQRSTGLERPSDYLAEVRTLTELQARFAGSAAVHDMASQQLGTYASFLGDHAGALRHFAASAEAPDTLEVPQLGAGYAPVDAVQAIVARAEGVRAVFVNEAHHVAQHRALTLALLEPLYALGYRYLAAETLNARDTLLNTRGYPFQTSGYYSREPLFGQLLRTALDLGYTLIPYEASGARSQEARETGQARNLKERIFDRDPTARVVVHAGYAHINESGRIAGAIPMASRFRELTGIDPLTVDQTAMTERADESLESPLYRRILDNNRRTQPFVFQDANGSLWSARPGVHDVTVFSPRTVLRDGRPEWRWSTGRVHAYRTPTGFCGAIDECVVAAWLSTEPDDAVPVDIVVQRAGESRVLLLPSGDYRIVAMDTARATLNRVQVTLPQR